VKRLWLIAIVLLLSAGTARCGEPWTEAQANAWYHEQPWIIGANYIPASAVNALEMWDEATFDPARIDLELGWAQDIGMNTVRVYLHDLSWQQDAEGFKGRISRFLEIADAHHIRAILVLFDSCWDPFPRVGPQPQPRPGVHNSRWVQSPGATALQDEAQRPRLEAYVKGVIAAFANDVRVLAWDLWNEPDNNNDLSYGPLEPANKATLVERLLPLVFAWARAAEPIQPLTSGVWRGLSAQEIGAIGRIQIISSDIVSFHSYEPPTVFETQLAWLQQYRRPVICTEYLARPRGSTFEGILPIARNHWVGAINWGLVAGKTQTLLPWDSWQHPYVDHEPAIWFHEVFRTDGAPYRSSEVQLLRALAKTTSRTVQ
jgi:hypothetical protein